MSRRQRFWLAVGTVFDRLDDVLAPRKPGLLYRACIFCYQKANGRR